VGKHTDELIGQMLTSTQGKTDCQDWDPDAWGGYERVLPPQAQHRIGKVRTQRLERTNGILRQHTGRWHRQQNKFGKQWEQTEVTTRLVVSYFNWMWEHSRFADTAAQRAGLSSHTWSWKNFAAFPTLL
jgi:IS1 family transposase